MDVGKLSCVPVEHYCLRNYLSWTCRRGTWNRAAERPASAARNTSEQSCRSPFN